MWSNWRLYRYLFEPLQADFNKAIETNFPYPVSTGATPPRACRSITWSSWIWVIKTKCIYKSLMTFLRSNITAHISAVISTKAKKHTDKVPAVWVASFPLHEGQRWEWACFWFYGHDRHNATCWWFPRCWSLPGWCKLSLTCGCSLQESLGKFWETFAEHLLHEVLKTMFA